MALTGKFVVTYGKDSDDSSFFARRCNLWTVKTERHRRQRRIVCGNHRLGVQVHSIEDLKFSSHRTARISQVAVVRVSGQRAKSRRVDWCVTDRMHDFHVSDVVNVKAFLKTNDQARPIQFHRLYRVRVWIIADFCSLFEVTNFELAGCVEWHNGQEGAAEQPFHDANVIAKVGVNLFELLIDRVQRVKCVSVLIADRERSKK